jgi:hypothetical protein
MGLQQVLQLHRPVSYYITPLHHTSLPQVILSNLALLAENGQLLLDASLPEEFLVPRPMRLTPEEVRKCESATGVVSVTGQ